MIRIILLPILMCLSLIMKAQSPGDTIRVQAFNFESTTRDSMISFPVDENITYEKILLKYTMRCKDALVSTGTDRNLGCGEWDFSCNTYLADSSKVEAISATTSSHFISNYEGTSFPFLETPVYDYMRGNQAQVEVLGVADQTTAQVGSGSETLDRVLSTSKVAGKSQYLYTAEELQSAGLSAGDLYGLSMNVLGDAGEAKFLKINIKNSSKSELDGLIDFEDFTEVYYNDQALTANEVNHFQFHQPFAWDGTSNVIVELSITNVDATPAMTQIEGGVTALNMGLSSTDEQEIMLTNNTYVECDEYVGVTGSQNRTMEAWIRTTDGSNGEICSWGTNVTSRKWVWRMADGLLRLEITGGGTVGSTRIDDGEWHHVACVLNGSNLGNISFYVDGVLDQNSEVGTASIDTGSSPVRISRGINNRYLNAVVDDVRIWDTNLSGETINNWKSLKLDENHPNYSNLQMNYEFNGSGNVVEDSSPNGRNANIIGQRFNTSELSGQQLFKDFNLEKNRPNLNFFGGEYNINVTTTQVDRPIPKPVRHFVITRTIEPTDPTIAKDDNILEAGPDELWVPEQSIFDEATGDLITINTLTPDGEINITDLEYQRRFPFYNELVSFVTPYGIGLDFGQDGASWMIDLSDYVHILKGDKRLLMTLGGQWQEDMDLEFLFIVGTPPRDVVQYDQIWQATNRIGIAQLSQIQSEQKFQPFDIQVAPDAETVMLKSSITGHGSEGEFQQNGGIINHRISIDNQEAFIWSVQRECSFNPIFPQGGTWVFDRQGWCPGEESLTTENDLTTLVSPGQSVNIDYNISNALIATGDYRYHVAHQLLGYGAPNFQSDAAVIEIIAPNNAPEYTRVGTVCANPKVVIQNTGAADLTSLTINYWLNDSQAPQSFEWSGNLAFMETAEVAIPNEEALWYDVLADNNKFHVEIANPNGGTDEYAFNNTYSSEFDFPEVLPPDVRVEVRTNNSPGQNSYQLFNSDNELVGANDLPASNTIYDDEYTLDDGCYRLVVFDSGGDGLEWWANAAQGSGFARIRNEFGTILETFNPDFGGGFEFSFATSFPTSVENLEFLTSINVFPNPANDYFNVQADDLTDTNVYLTNVMGQRVAAPIQSRGDNNITFSKGNLGSGIYFVVFEKGKVVTTRKVVLK